MRRITNVLCIVGASALVLSCGESTDNGEKAEAPSEPQAGAQTTGGTAVAPEAADEPEETGGMLGDVEIPDASEAVAQVSDSLKSAAEGYVKDLNEASDILGGIQDAAGAAAASPRLQPIVDRLNEFKATWDGLDPETRNQLASLFKDRMQPAIDAINGQIDRIRANEALAGPLEGLLGDIPRIEL